MNKFDEFLDGHTGRCHRHDWPVNRAFFAAWEVEFDRLGVTREEAEAASIEMAREPSRYPSDHLPTLAAKVKKIREAKARDDASARRPLGTSEEDRRIDAFWDSMPGEIQQTWLEWAAERLPAVATSVGRRSNMLRYLMACARCGAYDHEHGRDIDATITEVVVNRGVFPAKTRPRVFQGGDAA
jgi:hypothetical protein